MARETATQRKLRQAVDQHNAENATWAEFTRAYPLRFSALLFSYMSESHAGFTVVKLDEETYVFSRTGHCHESTLKVTPPVNYNWEYLNDMDEAEAALSEYAREMAEEARKRRVKEVALAKLNNEELEMLGLTRFSR